MVREQEAVVAQMVVGVVDGDGEDDPAPQFRKVRCRPSPVPDDELDQFQVARSGIMTVAVGMPEQRHGRGEVDAFPSVGAGSAVETPRQEGPVALAECVQDRLRNLQPGDLPLVLEDMGHLLRDWTGHDFAGGSTALLAETLTSAEEGIEAFGKGRARWLATYSKDERVRTFLGFNQHEATTWLNQEGLLNLLDALVVCGLTLPEPMSPGPMLDARGLVTEAAELAGYEAPKMMKLLTGK